jgi:hypothetical protein
MRRTLLMGSLVGCLTVWSAGPAGAGQTAQVTRAQAEKTALTKAPGGQIREGELEHEHGKLVWSFDISRPGQSGITEVQVDAHTGRIVSVAHESPAQERKETRSEKSGR